MANDNQYFKGQLETKKLPELRSEEVQEVLGWIPPWIQRAGITVLFVIVVVLLIGSWFFRYPDVIEAPLVVTSNNPPVQVNARANGKITHLLVINKQQVKESDYLAVIDNPANIHDVRDLRIKLSMWHELVRNENFFFTSEELNQKYELGDLQSSYLGFIRSAENYQQFTLLNYYPKRISAIEEQIGKQQQHHEKLLEQCNVVHQQYIIAQRQYTRDSTLSIQKTISDAEYDRSVISFLQSRHNYESSLIALENVIMQIDQLRQSILDLHLQELEKLGQLKAEVKAGLGNLLNSFNTWEMAYVLKTTVNGTVDFNKFWHVNQNVLAGETVFIIIPEDPGELLGKAQLPVAGSGKVKQGQAVNIRFLNFPDTEYGIVRGIVSSISVVPTSESYTLEVTFPNGLVTTYLNELPFCQEMYAVAEIITEDMRLLERLLMPLKRFVSEQK